MRSCLRSTIGWPAGIRAVSQALGQGERRYRIEHDSIGDRKVPEDAYYGVQTLRAVENFRITGLSLHPEIIYSLAHIKKAAAMVNCEIGLLDRKIADAIVRTCDEILEGKLHNHKKKQEKKNEAGEGRLYRAELRPVRKTGRRFRCEAGADRPDHGQTAGI